MYCKKCGKKLDYGDKFCSGCGANITPDIISPDPIETQETHFVEKEMKSIHDFERDDNESIGKAVEANFVIEDFDWDLDGFPEERDTRNDDLDFDWNPVLEKKNKKKEEVKVEEPVKEDVSIESFEDIIDTPTKEEIAHTIIELGLGSTARIEKDEFESYDEAEAEAEEADEVSSEADQEALEEEVLEEQALDGEFEDDEESSSDVSLFDELEIKEPDDGGLDLAGLGMASFDKDELDKAALEHEALKKEVEEDRAKEPEAVGVDKFYTFNQKNEEFQALLDQEYERLRKRLREESEAEELLNRKYERLEKARNTWAMGDLELVDSDKEKDGEENKYLNDAIKTLKEETVEIPKDDEFQKIIDSYADENIKANKEEEAGEALDEFVSVDEVKEEAEACEEASADAGEASAEDAEKAVEPKAEDQAADEAEAEKADEVDAGAGVSEGDEGVVVVQPAKAFVVDETKPKTEDAEDAAESGVTDKTIVLPPREQREKIKDMKAVTVVDYGDIFDEEEEEVPLTRKEKKALKKAEKEKERAEKKRQREEAKAKKAGKTVETDEPSEKEEAAEGAETTDLAVSEEPKKSSKAGLVFLDILIVVLTLVVCGAAIMAFAPDSFLGNKIGMGVETVKEKMGIGYDSKHAEKKEPTGSPVQKMIKNAAKDNANIGRVEEAPALVFSPSGDYAIKEVMQSVPFVDSVWHTDDGGNAVNYGDSIVKTTVKYYSDLVDKMTKGSDDILNLLVKDTDFYKNLEKTKALGEDKFSVDTLKIGEIRSLDNNYFVLVEVSEKNDGKDSVKKQLVQAVAQDKELKIKNIVDVK